MSTQANDLGIAERLRRRKLRDSRSQSLGTKLTRAEEREVIAVAREQGKPAGEWMREVLLREARRPKEDALFTEIVATRMLLVLLLQPLALGEKLTRENITEIMAAVRRGKRKATRDVLEQYTTPEAQEGGDGE